MDNLLKIQYQYLNPHEKFYDSFKAGPLYNKYIDESLRVWSEQGNLSEMEFHLLNLKDRVDKKEVDVNKLSNEFRFDLQDREARESILFNEIYRDDEEIKHYEEQVWNQDKAKYETLSYDMTPYEYNRMKFKQLTEYEVAMDEYRKVEQAKADRNWFVKTASAVGEFLIRIPYEIFSGAVDFIGNTLSFIEGFGRWVAGGFSADEFAKAYIKDTQVFAAWNNAGWREEISKWFGSWGYMSDAAGNLTNYGQLTAGVANSIGQFLPAMALTMLGVPGGISTALYYGQMGSGTFGDMVNDERYANTPNWEKFVISGAKTAAEYGMQLLVNKMFHGSTQRSAAIYGFNASKPAADISRKGALKLIAVDAAHEFTEEFFQEFSGQFIDAFVSVLDDSYEFDGFNLGDMIYAGAMGLVSSIATTTFGIVKRKVQHRLGRSIETSRVKAAKEAGVYDQLSDIDRDIDTYNKQRESLIEKLKSGTGYITDNGTYSTEAIKIVDEKLSELKSQRSNLESEYKINDLKYVGYRDGDIVDIAVPMNWGQEYVYRATIEDVYRDYNKLIKNKRLTDAERDTVVGQMLVTTSTLASMFPSVGAEMLSKAQSILQVIKQRGITQTKKFDTFGTGTQTISWQEKKGKAYYDSMASVLMETISSFESGYAQAVLNGMPEAKKQSIKTKVDKITKKESKTAEDSVETLLKEAGAVTIDITEDGSKPKINSEKTLATKIVENSVEKADRNVARVSKVMERLNLTAEEYLRLPSDLHDLVLGKNSIDSVITIIEEFLKNPDNKSNLKQIEDKITTNDKGEVVLRAPLTKEEIVARTAKIKDRKKAFLKQTGMTESQFNKLPIEIRNAISNFDLPVNQIVKSARSYKEGNTSIVSLNQMLTPKPTKNDAKKVIKSVKEHVVSFSEESLSSISDLNQMAKIIVDLGLPEAIGNSISYRIAFNEIYKQAKKILGKNVSIEEVFIHLFSDKNFVHDIVWTNADVVLDFLSSLRLIMEETVKNDTSIDTSIYNQIENLTDNIKQELMQYCMIVEKSRPELYDVFDNDEVRYIYRNRLIPDLIEDLRNNNVQCTITFDENNNVTIKVKGNVKYDTLGTVLANKINSSSDKNNIANDLKLYNKSGHVSVLRTIFNRIFNSKAEPYVNGDYFVPDSPEHVIADRFLVEQNLTLSQLENARWCANFASSKEGQSLGKLYYGENYFADLSNNTAIKAKVQQLFSTMFKQYSGENYTFAIERGKLVPKSISESNLTAAQNIYQFFNIFDFVHAKDDNAGVMYVVNRTVPVTENGVTTNKLFLEAFDTEQETLLSRKLSQQEKASLSVNDLVTDFSIDAEGNYKSRLLSNSIQKQIVDKFGILTPKTAYAFIKDWILDKSQGQYYLHLTNTGGVQALSIKTMRQSLKNQSEAVEVLEKYRQQASPEKDSDSFSVSELIREQFLIGILSEVKAKFRPMDNNQGGWYDPNTNTIMLNSNSSSMEILTTFLHEFKHAVQNQYSLNEGFSTSQFYKWKKDGEHRKITLELSDKKNAKVVLEMTKDVKSILGFDESWSYKEKIQWYKDITSENTVNAYSENGKVNTELLDAYILTYFVYLTSGEMEAFGISLNSYLSGQWYTSLYPTVIDGDRITLPSGNTYTIQLTNTDDSKITKSTTSIKTKETIVSDNFFVITNDGDVRTNEEYYSFEEYTNKEDVSSNDISYVINNSGNGSIKYDVYIGNTTAASQQGIINFVNKLQYSGAQVSLHSLLSGLSVELSSDMNSLDAIKSIGITPLGKSIKMSETIDADTESLEKRQEQKKLEKIDRRSQNKGVKTTEPRVTRKNDVYVSKDIAGDTPAKWLVGQQKNKKIVDFAKNADLSRLNPELVDWIKSGKITLEGTYGIYSWIRQSNALSIDDPTAQYTLELLNKTIFKNPYVDSVEVLQKLTSVGLAEYYALRRLLKADGKMDMLDGELSPTDIQSLLKDYSESPKWKKTYEQYVKEFYADYKSSRGTSSVNEGTIKLRLLQRFDGTVESGYKIAVGEISMSKLGYNKDEHFQTTSLNKQVGELKGGEEGGDTSLEEKIPDAEHLEAMDPAEQFELYEDLSDYLVEYLMENIFEGKVEEARKNGKIISEERYNQLRETQEEKYRKLIRTKNLQWVIDKLSELTSDGWTPKSMKTKPSTDERKVNVKSVKANITRRAKDIKNYFLFKNKYAKDAFLSQYADIFNDDLTLRDESYKGSKTDKDIAKYLDTNAKLADARYEVFHGRFDHGRKGMVTWDNKEQAKRKAKTRLETQVEKLTKVTGKQKGKIEGLERKVQELTIDGNGFRVVGDTEVPSTFQQLMDTTFSEFASTDVKYLSDENDIHMKESMKMFVKANSELFAQMDAEAMNELVDFIIGTQIVSTATSAQQADEQSMRLILYKSFTLAQLLAINDVMNGEIFTEQKVKAIEDYIKSFESFAGKLFTGTRDIAKTLQPFKQILKSMAQQAGLEEFFADTYDNGEIIETTDGEIQSTALSNLDTALHSGNMEDIIRAEKELYEKGWENYRRKRSTSSASLDGFLDKLWKFQRMAMLSSPGTWFRNVTSNYIVRAVNSVADSVGHLIFDKIGKSKQIEGQYRMTDKPTAQVLEYVQAQFFTKFEYKNENGKTEKISMYDLLSDGLNKWTPEMKQKFDVSKVLEDLPKVKDLELSDRNAANLIRKTYMQILTNMAAASVKNKIIMGNQFTSIKLDKDGNPVDSKVGKTFNVLSKALFSVLSDDPWVRKQTAKYFSALIQEHINDGKIKVEGLDVNSESALANETRLKLLSLFSDAFTFASHEYMHKQNFLSKIEKQISGHSKAAIMLWKQIFPFASASWNWFTEALKLSPMGLVKSIVDYAKLEKRIAKDTERQARGDYKGPGIEFTQFVAKRNVGKGVLGTILWGFGALLAGFGVIALDDDDDKLKLSVGPLTVDVSDLFGTSSLFAGAAMFTGLAKIPDAGVAQGIWDALIGMTNNWLDDSLFNDMFNTFQRRNTIGETLLYMPLDKATSFVPNMIKTFNKWLYVHQPQYSKGLMGWFERWGAQSIPGLVYLLPKRYDPYTGEVQLQYAGDDFANWLQKWAGSLGVKIYVNRYSSIEKEAIALGLNKGELTCNYTDIAPFDSEHKAIANEKYGQLNKKDLSDLYNNKVKYNVEDENGKLKTLYYRNMSDKQKKTVINRIMTNNGKIAKIYVYTQMLGGTYYASESEYKELIKFGIRKNVYRKTNKKEGFK